nr:hypothetical protein [Mycoplasmopsis canis]WQQ12703.1 hypothetical protein RRG48_01485 [Mycoplasmopsis canis]
MSLLLLFVFFSLFITYSAVIFALYFKVFKIFKIAKFQLNLMVKINLNKKEISLNSKYVEGFNLLEELWKSGKKKFWILFILSLIIFWVFNLIFLFMLGFKNSLLWNLILFPSFLPVILFVLGWIMKDCYIFKKSLVQMKEIISKSPIKNQLADIFGYKEFLLEENKKKEYYYIGDVEKDLFLNYNIVLKLSKLEKDQALSLYYFFIWGSHFEESETSIDDYEMLYLECINLSEKLWK